MSVLRVCEACGKEFTVYPSQIKKGQGKYCSLECAYSSRESHQIDCVCEVCNKSFTVPPSSIKNGGGRYCSLKCVGIAKRKQPNCICKRCGKAFRKSPTEIASSKEYYCSKECQLSDRPISSCDNCGKQFIRKPSLSRFKTKYCSRECHKEARRKALLRVDKTCQTCGKPFQTTPSLGERKKYCSVECRNLGNRRQIEVKCAFCGQPFTDIASKIRAGRRFCSNACATAANDKRVEVNCKICGKPFLSMPFYLKRGQGLYCSIDCANQGNSGSGNKRFRGGRVNRGPNWRRQRRLAYQRDGGICQRCGRKPKKGEPQFHVHHIKAYRDFNGDYLSANDLLNLITLCPSCHPRAELGLIYVPKRLF